ncbi:MAG: alpha/beta fold hydrolase [Anaerolineales bacterium]|nr:alpha/beta fold hydrolase [Anaerolineales bacterium]
MDVDIELYRREVRISSAPLVRLSAIDISPDRPARTMVFIHGFGGNATQWKYQLQKFSDDSRVIALDLRGFGLSDKPAGARYTMDEFVADIDTALTLLGVTEPFVLLGHSFGGAVVTEYAAAHPERVARLVLIAAAGEYRLQPLLRWALRLPAAVLDVAHALYLRQSLASTPAVLKTMFTNNLSRWNGWAMFRDLRVPALVIRGNRDRVLAARYFEEVARAIPGAEDVDVGVSAHMVMLERREAVNRAIERFVEGRKGRREAGADRHERLRRERPWLDHYDSGVPDTIGVPAVPIYRLLRSAARRFPAKTAIVFEGARLSYRDLNRESSRFANLLRSLGIQRGEKVLILLPNLPQTVIAYYGVLKMGGVVVFTTPLSQPEELARQVSDSGATVLVTLTRLAETARAVKAQTGLRHIVFTNVKDYLPGLKRAWFTLFREAQEGHRLPFALEPGMTLLAADLRQYSPHAPEVDARPEDLALIQYTSGTTAQPKGVMLSHRNLIANTLQTRHWIPALKEGRETFLSVLPFSHVYGMTAAMNVPVALAAAMVILPTFTTETVLEAIRRHRPTLFPGVPTMYMAINGFPGVRRYGIDSIKACISGAAPLPVEVQEAFEKLTRGRLVEGYGLTEATTVTHANPLQGRRKIGSIGIPLPSTEAKIVDLATGRDRPAGQLGELAVRGPQVMLGYWNAGAPASPVTRDGWLLTGDVARMDEEGYVEVVARRREMILAGDYQVYPRDVEEVLYEHPKVKEVAVVGVQAPRWPFQRVKAFVVPREGAALQEDELLALCKRRLEEYAVPWQIEFRRELPKNFVGKVIRRLLVEE